MGVRIIENENFFQQNSLETDRFSQIFNFLWRSKSNTRIDSSIHSPTMLSMQVHLANGLSRVLPLLFLGLTACRTPAPGPDPVTVHPAGIVLRVNFAEKYLVFEASHTFAAGEILPVMRDGVRVGRVRVLALRRNRIQSADILDGVPGPGDVIERPAPSQP